MRSKNEIIGQYKRHEKDTGSPDVQIALLTERINHLTEHFKVHKKDFHSKGIAENGRPAQASSDYLKKTDLQKYRSLIESLGLRR